MQATQLLSKGHKLLKTQGGFTLLLDGTTPRAGYAVSVTNICGPNYIKNARRALDIARGLAYRYPVGVGGWYDTESKRYFIDATIIIPSLDEAIQTGKMYNQLAIWDFANQKEVRL